MEKTVLGSWKEISDYLKRSRSTCQRWEVELGLPIHRIDGTPKARVFAYKEEIDRWFLDKQHLEEFKGENERELKHRKARFLLRSAATAIVLATTAFVLWRTIPERIPPIPEIKPSVAVLPFENLSRDQTLDNWAMVLPELLTIDLLQSRYMNTLPTEKTGNILESLNLWKAGGFSAEEVRNIASAAKVDYTVSGSLMKAGSKILIACLLQDPQTGESAGAFRHQCGREEDIFPAVDALTKEIKKSLNLSARKIGADIDRKVASITSNSLEAIDLFTQGLALRSFGRNPEAISCFEKALALDPFFASAHFGLFNAHHSLGHETEARQSLKKAFELSDRISGAEQPLIQGVYYEVIERNLSRALKSYEKMVALYPDNTAGSLSSARIYLSLEDWDGAIAAYERVLLSKSQNFPYTYSDVYLNLGRAYAAKGLYDKADLILDDFLNNRSNKVLQVNNQRILLHLVRGQFDSALALAVRTQALYPNIPSTSMMIGLVYQMKGDFAAAAREYRVQIDQPNPEDQFNGRSYLAGLYYDTGRIASSIDELNKIKEMAERFKRDQWNKTVRAGLSRCYRLSGDLHKSLEELDALCQEDDTTRVAITQELLERALTTLELGRIGDFDRQAMIILGLLQKDPCRKNMRYYDYLMGHRELTRKNVPGAIEHLERALAMVPLPYGGNADWDDQAPFYDSLAQAYAQAGDLAKAADLYEKITLLTTGKKNFGEIYARSFYRLGRIYEQQGLKPKAIENYKKFLDLWKEADPIFREVKDARDRLDKLGAAE